MDSNVVLALATHQHTNGRTATIVETAVVKPKTPIFKVIVAGEGGVGKTSIIQRYIFEYSTTPTMTVGSEFAYQELEVKNHVYIVDFKKYVGNDYLNEIEKIGINLHFLELKFT